MKYLSVVLLFISAFQDLVSADEPQVLQTETLADGDVWVDPAITEFRGSELRFGFKTSFWETERHTPVGRRSSQERADVNFVSWSSEVSGS